MTICVGGFLSENKDQKIVWSGLQKHLGKGNIFALTWESKAEKDLYSQLGKAVGLAVIKGAYAVAVNGASKIGAALLASQTVVERRPISTLFKTAKASAKLAG